MHIKIFFIVLAMLSLGARAEPPNSDRLEQTHLINSSVGALRFVLQNLEHRPYSYETNRAEIQISAVDDLPVQTIPVKISFSNPSFEFVDLNDDGYIDLLFYSSDIPNGSIPLPEVFLYIPKLKKFIKSNTLSGLGEISKSKHHGCVTAIYERNINGFITEEWCFNLKTGKWKMLSSEQVEVGGE